MLQPVVNTKTLHTFLLIFISLCLLSVCDAATKVCSKEEAFKAENDIDNLKDWDSVYRSYRNFAHCDDGAIWEGYSDAVGNLLASDWKSLYKLNKLCSADKGFKSFVLKHLDILIPANIWEVIISNATNKCPNGMRGLCKAILKRNDAVIRDIEQDKKQGKHSAVTLEERNKVDTQTSEGKTCEMEATKAFWGNAAFMRECAPPRYSSG